MLLGARAAIANLADFDEFVGTAVQELADEELQELIAPEEEDTVAGVSVTKQPPLAPAARQARPRGGRERASGAA